MTPDALPTLILVRGHPGSGKTTHAQALLAEAIRPTRHIENDMFFVGADGVYRFDITRHAEAKQWCLDETRRALEGGHDAIVSSTFTTRAEMKPYLDLGFPVRVIEMNFDFPNVHDVPEAVIAAKKRDFEPHPDAEQVGPGAPPAVRRKHAMSALEFRPFPMTHPEAMADTLDPRVRPDRMSSFVPVRTQLTLGYALRTRDAEMVNALVQDLPGVLAGAPSQKTALWRELLGSSSEASLSKKERDDWASRLGEPPTEMAAAPGHTAGLLKLPQLEAMRLQPEDTHPPLQHLEALLDRRRTLAQVFAQATTAARAHQDGERDEALTRLTSLAPSPYETLQLLDGHLKLLWPDNPVGFPVPVLHDEFAPVWAALASTKEHAWVLLQEVAGKNGPAERMSPRIGAEVDKWWAANADRLADAFQDYRNPASAAIAERVLLHPESSPELASAALARLTWGASRGAEWAEQEGGKWVVRAADAQTKAELALRLRTVILDHAERLDTVPSVEKEKALEWWMRNADTVMASDATRVAWYQTFDRLSPAARRQQVAELFSRPEAHPGMRPDWGLRTWMLSAIKDHVSTPRRMAWLHSAVAGEGCWEGGSNGSGPAVLRQLLAWSTPQEKEELARAAFASWSRPEPAAGLQRSIPHLRLETPVFRGDAGSTTDWKKWYSVLVDGLDLTSATLPTREGPIPLVRVLDAVCEHRMKEKYGAPVAERRGMDSIGQWYASPEARDGTNTYEFMSSALRATLDEAQPRTMRDRLIGWRQARAERAALAEMVPNWPELSARISWSPSAPEPVLVRAAAPRPPAP